MHWDPGFAEDSSLISKGREDRIAWADVLAQILDALAAWIQSVVAAG